MPSVDRQKSRGGNCTGATAPSRKNRSRGDVLNSAWAPPSVMAVRVTRGTASPTKDFALESADSVAGGGALVWLWQGAEWVSRPRAPTSTPLSPPPPPPPG